MAIVWAVAWAYAEFGTLPAVGALLAGIKPVVLAVIAQALWGLGRTALVSAMTLAIGVLALVALLMGVNEVLVLAIAGALAWLDWRMTRGGNLWERGAAVVLPLEATAISGAALHPVAMATAALATVTTATVTAATVSLGKIFLAFTKAGALLFGSGYVLIAFLRADFVTRTGWLTEAQLLDAIAVGQFTPGPLFTTATFVGYQLAGHAGALVATAGIFLPAFLFVALTAPMVHRLRDLPSARAALGGLNVASLALMAAATAPIARDAFAQPWLSVPLFAAALAALIKWRVNSAWLVLGGAVIGWLAGAAAPA
jgi:chromate transporter